jgi:hypothetical protein
MMPASSNATKLMPSEVPSEREPLVVSVAWGQSHPNAESGGAGERR